MTVLTDGQAGVVHGRIDLDGRLREADPPLAGLHARAGGEAGGPLAVPQIAALARLARRLGIVISRGVIAADEGADLDLWVCARPDADGVLLEISGWHERPAYVPSTAPPAEREGDFLRAAADWMWETDEKLRFTALSPAAAATVGRSPTDFIGEQLTRLFRFQESADGSLPILTALAEQRRFDDQLAELRSGGPGRYRLAAVPLIDGSGRFVGFRGKAGSIAAGEEEPAMTPSPPAVQGVGGAFGERLDKALRTPLEHIISNAETMIAQAEGPLRRDYTAYVNDIATAGRHLRALVDDLVDLQAIERPDFRPDADPIDLAEIARRAAGLLGNGRAVERRVRIEPPAESESAPALGEFRRALQIVMNLLTNAIRYSPEGGQVLLRAERAGAFAALTVIDFGKGISPDDQAKIFGKFERVDPSEPGGSGLGLYISRRLARAMGGDLTVASEPGQGARFTLTLPVR